MIGGSLKDKQILQKLVFQPSRQQAQVPAGISTHGSMYSGLGSVLCENRAPSAYFGNPIKQRKSLWTTATNSFFSFLSPCGVVTLPRELLLSSGC